MNKLRAGMSIASADRRILFWRVSFLNLVVRPMGSRKFVPYREQVDVSSFQAGGGMGITSADVSYILQSLV